MKIVTADITGSLIVNGVDVTNNVVSSSVFSGSIAGRVTSLEQFSASLDATFATDASVTASILVLSQSVQASQAALSSSYVATSASYLAVSQSYVVTSGSYSAASQSLSTRTTNLEATASTNTQASASFAAYSASMSTRLTTDETNITTLTNASASFANQSASLSTRLTTDETNYTNLSSSFATTSGSVAGRVTLIEGQYATTGSNTFTKPQQITDVSNAISFTSTASLYTDGGLRVKGSSFISGTAYFNNVVVYGTSSIQYLTSSQVAIGTNIITLNTDTPSIRFGGISVYDSGSNNLSTGSLFWDSEKDRWIYSNPSGSSYDGGMLISGPRNTSGLGNEVGTTSCALMMGQGGDHITSSAIFSYGNATCFYGQSYISSSGTACFAGTVCAPTFDSNCARLIGKTSASPYANSSWLQAPSASGMFIVNSGVTNWIGVKADGTIDSSGTFTHAGTFCVNGSVNVINSATAGIRLKGNSTTGTDLQNDAGGAYIWNRDATPIFFATNNCQRLSINSDGIAVFSCQVCAAGNLLLGGAGTANTIPQYTAAGVLGNSKMTTYGNGCYNVNFGWSNCARIGFDNDNTGAYFYGLELDNGTRRLNIIGKAPDGNTGVGIWTGTTYYCQRLNINSDGIACFACQACAPTISISGNVNGGTATFNGVAINNSPTSAGTSANFIRLTNAGGDFYIGQESSTGGFFTGACVYDNVLYGGRPLNIIMGGSSKVVVATNGVTSFACQICTAAINAGGELYLGSSASNYSIISRATSPAGSQGITLTGGVRKAESAGGLTFADNSCSGATINLLGNSSDIYGGSVEIIAYGQTNTTGNQIVFYSRQCNATLANRFAISGQGIATFACPVIIATSCRAFGRNLTVQGDVVAYYSDQESITMGISAGTGAQSWGIQVCDTGDGSNALHLNARGGYVGINKGAGVTADYPLDVTGTTKTTVLLVGSACSPSAGINYLGQEGYRQKWLITQGRYRFCFGTQDFYGAMFIEVYGTNYNQGTSELRNVKAAINLRYGLNRSIGQIYNLGGACVGAYLTNGIGLVWCNISDTVGDLIYTNAGSLQPDSVLATELHFLSAGYSLAGKFTRICYTSTLYDSTNPYV